MLEDLSEQVGLIAKHGKAQQWAEPEARHSGLRNGGHKDEEVLFLREMYRFGPLSMRVHYLLAD